MSTERIPTLVQIGVGSRAEFYVIWRGEDGKIDYTSPSISEDSFNTYNNEEIIEAATKDAINNSWQKGYEELKADEREVLRTKINDAWKEVYHQLGKNKKNPLNDDEFLTAHWIMYFKYKKIVSFPNG